VTSSDPAQWYDFGGRTIVMTGGTGVLGSEMVRALVGCGANVALLARNCEKAAALRAELTSLCSHTHGALRRAA
jgi:NAD(P)-dependent dehydrogenase (short-subunit alcohol dehydrogenase family)